MAEEQFQPTLNENQTRSWAQMYNGRSHLLPEERRKEIEANAAYYNVPFFEGDSDLLDKVGALGKGFLEGMSASIYHSKEPPKSQTESIIKNIGHLIGFAPSILSAPLRKLQMTRLANIAARTKSLPLWLSGKATKHVSKAANDALKSVGMKNVDNLQGASKLLLGGGARHVAEGAFNLGVASSLGAWRGGIDSMVQAAIGGGIAGGVFHGIGNVIPGTATGDKALRAMAGSAFQGLSAQSQGATTPDAIYEYLLGAYFGGTSASWKQAEVYKLKNNIMKESQGTVSQRKKFATWEREGSDVERHPMFHNLPKEVQKLAKEQQVDLFGDVNVNKLQLHAVNLMKQLGLTPETEIVERTPEGFIDKGEYREGEKVFTTTESDVKAEKFIATTGTAGDKFLSKIAGEYGLPSINYVLQGKPSKGAIGLDRPLTEAHISEANRAIRLAAERLNINPTTIKDTTRAALAKNYWAVKNAQATYIVGQLTSGKRGILDKNLKWATTIAQNMGKPLFVYDTVSSKWYQYMHTGTTGRFRIIPGKKNLPPSPPNAIALLGATGINKMPNVQKAVRGWLKQYRTKASAADAVQKKTEEATFRQSKREKELIDRQRDIQKSIYEYDVIRKDKKLTDDEKADLASLKDEAHIIEGELATLIPKTVSKLITHGLSEQIKLSAEEIDQMVDDSGVNPSVVGKSAINFTDAFLKKIWGKADTTRAQRDERIKISEMLEGIMPNFIKRGSLEVNSEEFIEAVEKQLKTDYELAQDKPALSDEARRNMRGWLIRKNLGYPVIHLRGTKDGYRYMSDPRNPVSLAGNRKAQEEPLKRIQEAWMELGGKLEDIPMMILDHVTVEGKKGLEDRTISQHREKLGVDSLKYQEWLSNLQERAEKEGYYILGGNGDKDRFYFMKYHPEINRLDKRVTPRLNDIVKILEKNNPDFKKFLEVSRNMAEKKSIHDKQFLSNLYYDLAMNGLNITDANIKLIAGKGFINNSKGYNKRAQIWNTVSYPGDRKFIANTYVDKNGISMLNDRGGYNFIIVKDLAKELKDYSDIKLTSIENPENIDGAIIVPDRLIDAINLSAGTPDSGQNKSFITSPHSKRGALLGKYMIHAAGPKLSKMMEAKGLHMIMQESAVKQRGDRKVGDYDILPAQVTAGKILKTATQLESEFQHWIDTLQYSPKAGKDIVRKTHFYQYDKKGNFIRDNFDRNKSAIEFAASKGYKYDENIGTFLDLTEKPITVKESLDIKGSETYHLPVEHLHASSGVYGSSHMLDPQRIPKQVLGNLLPFIKSPIDQKIIDEAFNDIIGERWLGEDSFNERVDTYLKSAETGVQDRVQVDKIVDNLEKVGIDYIVRMIKNETSPELSEAVYKKMLKITEENIKEDFESGELTANEYKQAMTEIAQFNGLTDRVLRIASDISQQARGEGLDITADAIFSHKLVRDFRMRAVQNFVVNTATKPKRESSGVGFMRPYDKALRVNLDKVNKFLDMNSPDNINKNDKIFMLDNKFKDLKVHAIGEDGKVRPYRLEVLWNRYQKLLKTGKTSPELTHLNEVLTALTVRVPMDSASGAQVMQFAGFTGRKGHGILMHSRAMRAEGGADLDGDKSFFFFGGPKGLSPDLRNAFLKNKDEFYNKDKTKVKDNKKDFRDFLTKTAMNQQEREILEMADTKAGYYSPSERVRQSTASVDGRNQLGPAVINKQLMAAAYNSIRAAGGTDDLTFNMQDKEGKWRKFSITLQTKDSEKDNKYQRSLGRAMIGFASDPMDEIGLTGKQAWQKELWQAYFNVKDVKVVTKDKKARKATKKEKDMAIKGIDSLPYKYMTSGIYGKITNINKALWGKNWTDNRRWSMSEILELNESAFDISNIKGANNSFVTKTGEMFAGVDWSDNIFTRLNPGKVKNMYDWANKQFQDKDELASLLGRKTLKVPYNAEVKNIVDNKLWDIVKRKELSSNWEDFKQALKGTQFLKNIKNALDFDANHRLYSDIYINTPKGRRQRVKALEEFTRRGEELLVNDVSDLVTTKLVNNLITNMSKEIPDINLLKKRIAMIHGKVETLKRRSYLMLRARNKIEKLIDEVKPKKEEEKSIRDFFDELYGKTPQDVKTEKSTAVLDQAQIDIEIDKFRAKYKLTPLENELFDQLMLGSLNRGKLSTLEKFEKKIKKVNPLVMDALKTLRWDASKTSFSRLGFNSLAVPDISVKKHIKEYLALMSNNHRPLTSEQAKEMHETLDNKVNIPEFLPEDLQKAVTTTGFEGLNLNQRLKKTKDDSLIVELAELIRQNPRLMENNGKNLGEFVRGLSFIQKDFNAMNINDFKKLKNFLEQTKRGTIWQRMKRFLGKDPYALSWRHYMQLPETNSRELMAKEIDILHKEGFFTDKFGTLQRGKIAVPTQVLDRLSNNIAANVEAGIEEGDELISKFQDDNLFYQSLNEAPHFWKIAMHKRDVRGFNEYKKRAIKANKSDEDIQAHFSYLSSRLNKAEKAGNWGQIKHQDFYVNIDGQRIKLTGEEIVNRINDNLTNQMQEAKTILRGDSKVMNIYLKGYYDRARTRPQYDVEAFISDINTHAKGKIPERWKKAGIMQSPNENIPKAFGIDGVRAMLKEMMYDILKNSDPKKAAEFNKKKFQPTGQLDTRTYFPRMYYEPTEAKARIKAAREEISNDPNLSTESKIKRLADLQYKIKRLDGDYMMEDLIDIDGFDHLVHMIQKKEKINLDELHWFDADVRMGNMRKREHDTRGWSISPNSVEAYLRSSTNTFYRGIASLLSRHIINHPTKGMYKQFIKTFGKEQTEIWQTFAKLYANDAIGHSIVVTKDMIENPKMHLKYSPYKWWADNRIADRLQTISEKLGLGTVIPAGVSKETVDGKVIKTKRDKQVISSLSPQDLRRWSNMEAKYQMATLLTRPKTIVANLLGGTLHTIQNASWSSLRKVYNYEYLQQINPKWKTRSDVEADVIRHGVLPEYLIYEMGLQKEFDNIRGKKMIETLSKRLKKDPNLSSGEVRKVLKEKYKGISDKVVNVAAKFMSVPERRLRTDSFMAHYINAWEKFGGAIQDPSHPFLIEMAKKGVKATQFMYSAAYRPAFARTAIGKVFARFQMYAYKSQALRNEVLRNVEVAGFDPLSEEGRIAQRFVMGDMMMIALANAFMYSIFENNLPQPLGWFQDTAEWIFGDEKERDRAFFGAYPTAIAPLQAITPPALRLVGPSIKALADDDWSRIMNYYLYTLFPFGVTGKDFLPWVDNNLLENPNQVIDKWIGVPMYQMQRGAKELKEKNLADEMDRELTYPRGIIGGYE